MSTTAGKKFHKTSLSVGMKKFVPNLGNWAEFFFRRLDLHYPLFDLMISGVKKTPE